MTGIVGKKVGMTQIFAENGNMVPVTVIEAPPGLVVEVKTKEKHGYESVKIGFFETKGKRLTKPEKGVFEKAGLKTLYKMTKEFPMDGLKVGDTVSVDKFAKGDKIKVSGVSKGKGFQGVMKRHNFAGGPGSHGSMFNRAPGSIGASSFPSRVWKGQKMAGHMGSVRVSTRNLIVADVRPEQNLILVRGSVPGAPGTIIEIRKDS
jgi:large subunit ribosomal protein L3